jgi:hypothetical protein
MKDDISQFILSCKHMAVTAASQQQFVKVVARVLGGPHNNLVVQWTDGNGRIFQFSLEGGLRSHYSGWGGDRGMVSESHPLRGSIRRELERNHLYQEAKHNMLSVVVEKGGWYMLDGKVAIEIREAEVTGDVIDGCGWLEEGFEMEEAMESIHLVLMSFRRLSKKLPLGAGKFEVMTAARDSVEAVFGNEMQG